MSDLDGGGCWVRGDLVGLESDLGDDVLGELVGGEGGEERF